jgi:hypothetical protein
MESGRKGKKIMGDKNDSLVSAVCTTVTSRFILPKAAVSVILPFITTKVSRRRQIS